MSPPPPSPRRRRPRTVFHYKVDDALAPADHAAYLALLREPRTTIDAAHAWLRGRGYAMSRSAVARHRRRLLARTADADAALTRALAVARMAEAPGAPDLSAAAEAYWKHLVFERLLAAGEPSPGSAATPGSPAEPAVLTPAELLDLGKLVAQAVELTRQRVLPRPPHARKPPARPPAGAEPANRPRSNEELRKEFDDIMSNRA